MGKSMQSKFRLILMTVLLAILSVTLSPTGAAGQTSKPMGHGTWVSGTLKTDLLQSNGWLNTTLTFTSNDLKKAYGTSTVVGKDSMFTNVTGTKSNSTAQTVIWFILRQDETPLLSGTAGQAASGTVTGASTSGGNSTLPALSTSGPGATQNGFIYPQWTYQKLCDIFGNNCYYQQSDPVNFAFEYKPLDTVSNYLINNKGWYDSWWCSNTEYIYDFSGYGWKTYDKTLAKGTCSAIWSPYRDHVRLFVMANGRIAAGAHYEQWDPLCNYGFGCHRIRSWEQAEQDLGNDLTGLYPVAFDNYWLNNQKDSNGNDPQGVAHDGYATTVPTSVVVNSHPTTDTYCRSHGLAVDSALPVPWWPPYQSGYEFLVSCGSFTYTRYLYLDHGTHSVEEAASGFVPNYAWHSTVTIYVVATISISGDVGRYNHLAVSFNV